MSYKYLEKIESNSSRAQKFKSVVFVVEGIDDGMFLEHILDQRGEQTDRVGVYSVGGKSVIWGFLSGLVKSEEFISGDITHICVALDADNDLSSVVDEAKRCLDEIGLPQPSASESIVVDGVKVGLFVFPNSKDAGELEDILLQVFSEDERIKDAKKILEKHNLLVGGGLKKMSKRVIQISLALSNSDLCAGVGRGIRNGAFDLDEAAMPELKDFLDKFTQNF